MGLDGKVVISGPFSPFTEVPTTNCSTAFEAVTEMCRNFSLQVP